MDSKLIEVFRFLGLENYIDDPKFISFRFEDDRIEAYYFEGDEIRKLQIGEATDLDIERIARLLLSCEGMKKGDDIYDLVYSTPFLIQIPAGWNHILLNKVGPDCISHPTIRRLWKNRIPYVLTEEYILFKENGIMTREQHEGQKLLKSLKGDFYGMAFDMDAFSSQHPSGDVDIKAHTETITLPNGDLIIIHFKELKIVEFNHMMK